MGAYQLYVLGCRGSRPVFGAQYKEFGGATSCYILKAGQHAVVLDCGTGLYEAKEYLKDCEKIDILLTHLHYDHILGLLDWSVFPEDARIRLYAGVAEYSKDYNPKDFLKPPFWPVSPKDGETICVGYDSVIFLNERVSVTFHAANHPDNATIIRVNTDQGAMCLVCDWEHGVEFPRAMGEGCDYIIYDGMFTEMEYPTCVGWGHSTWQEGVKLVQELGVPRLYITHHLPERTDEALRAMENYAKQAFPAIHFVRMNDRYSFDMGEK